MSGSHPDAMGQDGDFRNPIDSDVCESASSRVDMCARDFVSGTKQLKQRGFLLTGGLKVQFIVLVVKTWRPGLEATGRSWKVERDGCLCSAYLLFVYSGTPAREKARSTFRMSLLFSVKSFWEHPQGHHQTVFPW